MDYNFRAVEEKWRKHWAEHKTFKTENDFSKEKCYVLDMFPYPSGAGLHVGHPLGYIASDIYSRYKKLKGLNVLHPMGYDAFGLPAEQYAIQTGQHPKITTDQNLKQYRTQLDKIGFSFDWDREIRTCEPNYYKWTQWIFSQLFDAWFDQKQNKAVAISELEEQLASNGTENLQAACTEELTFTAEDWNSYDADKKAEILLNYRLAYLSESMVNWCPALGTVLANDEVVNGVSERGGHPVERKLMLQWSLRISAYSERLLQGLNEVEWTDALKEMQRNWIGKSVGASVNFKLKGLEESLEVFTTRPDTIYGVSFMVLAPESDWVEKLTTAEQQAEVDSYVEKAKNKTERERQAEVKNVTGVFSGSYAIHPFTGNEIPIWIGDYVLAGYGTGAVMAVAAHDSRDYAFAKKFELPIIPVIEGGDIEEAAYEVKSGKMINSDFMNGMKVKEAMKAAIQKIWEEKLGERQTNYRLRDAIFGRQRYWGEPIPIQFNGNVPSLLDESELPLNLPEIDEYLPTEDGDPPLGRAKDWKPENGERYELSTMPGWAGSSWYYLRYMDPHNDGTFASREATDYWNQVDLYIGGTEHATGHLLYSRFWCKVLFDLGHIGFDEPFKKLINQGMILGTSNFVYRENGTNKFVSKGLIEGRNVTPVHADVNLVKNDVLDIEGFKAWRSDFSDAEFELEDGKYICGEEVEKMSKSKYNVVNPDDIIADHGADVLRLYEMFLGPLEQSKPWSTKGIDGVSRFIRKYWNLHHDDAGQLDLSDDPATPEELKVLHTLIKKATYDIENFSFNTSVSAFMVCVNDLAKLKCNKKSILKELAIVLCPYAPFVTEELWSLMGEKGSISTASFPACNESYLVESSHQYPVSFNGKMRFKLELPIDLSKEAIEEAVLSHENSEKWLEGKSPKKVIVVPKKIVNIVI